MSIENEYLLAEMAEANELIDVLFGFIRVQRMRIHELESSH